MKRRPPRLVLFAGLGIDGGVFRPQRALPARVETPDYVDPRPDDTFATYAARMAARVAPAAPGERLYLGGLSFGACVALEAARVLRPRGVFYLSAGFSGRALAPWIRPVLAGVPLVSPWQLRQLLRLAPLFFRIVGPVRRRERPLLTELVARVNPLLARWGGPEIVRWSFDGPMPVPLLQIHGEIDHIVPARNVRPDLLVRGAGHAVNVTHADVVNPFIAQKIA